MGMNFKPTYPGIEPKWGPLFWMIGPLQGQALK